MTNTPVAFSGNTSVGIVSIKEGLAWLKDVPLNDKYPRCLKWKHFCWYCKYKGKTRCSKHTELRNCMKVEVSVLGSTSLTVLVVSVDVKQHGKRRYTIRAQELCGSRGGHPGLPAPNSPCGFCGREAMLSLNSKAITKRHLSTRHYLRCRQRSPCCWSA